MLQVLITPEEAAIKRWKASNDESNLGQKTCVTECTKTLPRRSPFIKQNKCKRKLFDDNALHDHT